MPSHRVTGQTLSLSIFEVVGQDGDEADFIGHTGLAQFAGSQQAEKVAVLDMGPPLHGQSAFTHVRASVVGNAVLNDDEVRKIKTFIDRHANEHLVFLKLDRSELLRVAPQMYCIHPHVSPLNEADGRYARTRFSCAGFVFEAYKKARITFVDSNALPMIDLTVVKQAYPREVRLMERGKISPEALGLQGSGPWPIMLCGYLFHALNRDLDVVRNKPYAPIVADRYFS